MGELSSACARWVYIPSTLQSDFWRFQVPQQVYWCSSIVVHVHTGVYSVRECARVCKLRRAARGVLRRPVAVDMVSKKRRWHSPDDRVGAKLECYYQTKLGPDPQHAALTAAALYPRATCDAARRATIDFIDMVLTGDGPETYRETLVRRWAGAVTAAWLPDTSIDPTPTAVKILRKGALNQPLSVRYLHAQLERACTRPTDDTATLLLRDIVVSHCRGLFQPPPAYVTVSERRALVAMTPAMLFAKHLVGSRSMVLHRMVGQFLSGVSMAVSASMRHAMQRRSLSVSIPLPALAYRGIFKRALAAPIRPAFTTSFSLSSSEVSASGLATLVAVTDGASAKRAKIAVNKLSASDRSAVAAQCSRKPVASIVPLDAAEWDRQAALPTKVMYLCLGCKTWRPARPTPKRRSVVVDLWQPSKLFCGSCKSDKIVRHVLNGRMLVTSDPWRLCSLCGGVHQFSELRPLSTMMVCASCATASRSRPACVVCSAVSCASTVVLSSDLSRFVTVGLCESHDVAADALPVDVTVGGLCAFINLQTPRRTGRRCRR